MTKKPILPQEIFSFHSFCLPFYQIPFYLFGKRRYKKVKGLVHSEFLIPMSLGLPLFSWKRYKISGLVLFALWQTEEDLNQFLLSKESKWMQSGWHVRLRMIRRWGKIQELAEATVFGRTSNPDQTTISITLARLKLTELLRFTKWGKPVESQVKNHPGKQMAFAAFRPPRHFLTFSIWKTETDIVQMVNGNDPRKDGIEHREAMAERKRKDFHFEFTTLRFEILGGNGLELGINSKSV
ncbi:hypothetical protein LEP1GSC202_2243 [Leptospira yanagawae serovar Saopaulo str. Sao Paulo = ATCC 700523]|uniref:Spheroidene monooxygenase n=1 Tax=Leptospira yanagawae serovar Saopaulo str. Sao Paulo = ATCC 700523 TaxID=1249483 RepID=A0A5E8HEP2_9LEPT|nr:hypothetical protein [Leptospira yanagawae]EOQ88456.1 hypothetical protein LEP1GSC202_2243 [Leptospira yanagawae serovar Saopaulo str. Sao Paulo = ATCC 700523]